MKNLWFSPSVCCALVLCACGDTAASQDNTAYVGNYVCTGITMDGLAMNPRGKWLELHADGTATTFLTAASNEAEWQLSGEAFTMTIAGKTVATGTLQSNQLTLEMSGWNTPSPGRAPSLRRGTAILGPMPPSPATGGFTLFGMPRMCSTRTRRACPTSTPMTGPKAGSPSWTARSGSPEWLASFDAKGTSETVTDYQTMDLTVAGYSARAIVYQDETGWNSEVLVNFGKDLGNDTYPMYAAYLYFTGPTYLSVWSEDVQAIVNSLTLPQ